MSGFGKATPRAWQRGVAPRIGPMRDDVTYAIESERMAHIIAGMFCTSCGTTADAEGNHAADCIDVPRERRRTT